mgnify:CR=1 FL=1
MVTVFYSRVFFLMLMVKEHRVFLCILVFFLLLRVPLLFTSQGYLDADEAVVALMAKHIVEKGEHPVFFSGLPYNGGASVEAHLAALLSYLFGLSRLTVKVSVLLLSLCLLVATYMFCLRYLGRASANIASLLLVAAEPLIIWNLKARGGYLETMLFTVLIPWIALRIFFHEGERLLYSALFGFFCGLALWCQEMSLSLLGAMFLFWFISDRTFFLRRFFAVFLIFFALGNGPAIYYNLTHNFINWRHMFTFLPSEASRYIQHATPQAVTLSSFFTHAAGFFEIISDGWEGWPIEPRDLSLFAWASFGVVLVGVSAALYLSWRSQWHWRISLLCLVYFILHLITVYVSSYRMGGGIYRFYLPLYPLLSVDLAIFCVSLRGRRWGLAVIMVLLLMFSGHGAMKNIHFLGVEPVWTHPDFEIHRGKIQPIPVRTGGESITKAVEFLRSHGIRSVITSVYIKYRLIFESREEINATSQIVPPPIDPYIYYDRLVQEDRTGPFAFVFFNASAANKYLLRLLKEEKVPWTQKTIHELTIYYPFTRADLERMFRHTPAKSFFTPEVRGSGERSP